VNALRDRACRRYDTGRADEAQRLLQLERNAHTVSGVLKLWLRECPGA
jgi:hypothetical protein